MNRIIPLLIFILTCLHSQRVFSAQGVIVVSGGGPEGELDEKTAWSYPLYKRLIDNGSINGRKEIKVVIVSLDVPETTFIADYFKKMGATTTKNITVDSVAAANNPKLVGTLEDADVVFFRGGNQGDAYKFWKGSLLEKHVKRIAKAGGAIGGTSSGAMSLSEYSMTGGKDFDSLETLANPHSPLLEDIDRPGTTGIHNDFLNLVPGTIVDTHCAERARLGRLLAVHAKASEDYNKKDIIAICVEETTGIAISNGKAEVYGTGLVHFIQPTSETILKREAGKPLIYSNMRDDALTEHWIFDLNTKSPDLEKIPTSATSIEHELNPPCGSVMKNERISSNKEGTKIEYSIDKNFQIKKNKKHSIKNVLVAYNAYFGRARNQTNTLRGLYDLPHASALLVPAKTNIIAQQDTNLLTFKKESNAKEQISTLVLDCNNCTYKSLSSFFSNQDFGKKNLHSAGFINLRIHALAGDYNYNVRTHKVENSQNPQLEIIQCNTDNPSLPETSVNTSIAPLTPVIKLIEICEP